MKYQDSVKLPRELSLAVAETVAEHIREVGSTRDRPQFLRRIDFEIEAADLWEMRETLADLEKVLASYGVEWSPDREKLGPEGISSVEVFERIEWHQQMYNGYPTCPMCEGAEPTTHDWPPEEELEGHRAGCLIAAALGRPTR